MASVMTVLHGLYLLRLDRSEAMYPHDYYNGDSQPYLHNHEEGGLYVEPDYWANDCDAQLPLLSTIGRGPQGVGLYVGNTVDEDGNVSFALYSDDTHEMVWQSPNLAAAQIEFSSDDYRDIVPGEPAQLTITQKRGGTTKTDIAYIPCGTQGSLVYLLNVERERSKDDTYTATVSELTIYDQSAYDSKPTPRVNDIVYFTYHSKTEYGFAFGTIEAVEGDTVVFTARTFIAMPPVSIGANGNWYVDGKDTKVQAKGEKGDKGDKGDKGATGKNAKVSVGTTTQLEPGSKAIVSNSSKTEGEAILDFGIPEGKPAKLAQVDVTNIEPGEKAYGEVEQISSNENSYKLNLGLPRGEDGKTFDVQNGVWSLEDLPEFDETPINTVYVVEDEDGAHHYYIRGRIAYDAELGGPWTVVDVMNYDNLNDVPLKLVNGKWVSQRGGKLPVEWGADGGTQEELGGCVSTGLCAHAEGYETKAKGMGSHSEGSDTIVSGDWSHAEGTRTQAEGAASHSEGSSTIASGTCSHAEGFKTQATGIYTHAEGGYSIASGRQSHAEGATTAQGEYQHTQGRYNVLDKEGKYAHIVGGGKSDTDRKNIHTVDWSGNADYAGDVVSHDSNNTAHSLNAKANDAEIAYKLTSDGKAVVPASDKLELLLRCNALSEHVMPPLVRGPVLFVETDRKYSYRKFITDPDEIYSRLCALIGCKAITWTSLVVVATTDELVTLYGDYEVFLENNSYIPLSTWRSIWAVKLAFESLNGFTMVCPDGEEDQKEDAEAFIDQLLGKD